MLTGWIFLVVAHAMPVAPAAAAVIMPLAVPIDDEVIESLEFLEELEMVEELDLLMDVD